MNLNYNPWKAKISLSLSLSLFVFLFVCLFRCLSLSVSVSVSLCLFVSLSVCLSVCLSLSTVYVLILFHNTGSQNRFFSCFLFFVFLNHRYETDATASHPKVSESVTGEKETRRSAELVQTFSSTEAE